MEALDKLFGSPHRVKVMRFFLMNSSGVFLPPEVAKSSRISRPRVRKELNFLKSVGFLKKKHGAEFYLNNLFPYLREFRALVIESAPISRELLQKRFKRLGKGIRLVLLSGVFIKSSVPGHIDILVVGDNIKRSKVEKILGQIETELGKELNYALFDTKEFKYRQGMYDRFILDILESEHDVLIDNLKA